MDRELMVDHGRSSDDRCKTYDILDEMALWEDMLKAQNNEQFSTDMPDNQANIVLKTINVIRARSDRDVAAQCSVDQTNLSLGITEGLL